MSGEPNWQVVWSLEAIAAASQLATRAREIGIGKAFGQAVKEITRKLHIDPLTVGEIYWSRNSIERHLAIEDLLAIDYSIDIKRKLVLVRVCNALSGRGL